MDEDRKKTVLTDILTPEEVAPRFGVTPLALIRFARKFDVPLIEMSRGVYRLTPDAVRKLQDAAQCRSKSDAGLTRAPLKLPEPSGLRAPKRESAFDAALALTKSGSRGKKPSRSRGKSFGQPGTANVLPIGSLAKRSSPI